MRISDWSSDVCSSDLFSNCSAPRNSSGQQHRTHPRSGLPRPIIGEGPRALFAARKIVWLARNLAFATFYTCCERPNALVVATLAARSEEHTSELQSLMRISYAVFCLKNKKQKTTRHKRVLA